MGVGALCAIRGEKEKISGRQNVLSISVVGKDLMARNIRILCYGE